jgi:flagellar FliL protein
VLVAIILTASGVYYFLYQETKENDVTKSMTNISTPTIQEIEKDKAKIDLEKISKIGPLYPLSLFTLNLRSDRGNIYLLVKLDFELSIKELKNELDAKNAVIRDAIIRILTSKSLEDLSSDEGKEEAIDEIINDINKMLHDGYIKNIYFTKFIVQ